MWVSYFHKIQNKYSMRLSLKKTLVIRLDAKNTTKNMDVSLVSKNKNGFLESFEKTIKHFTQKYKCLAIYGSDEVSFIFENPMILIEDLDKDNNRVNEIISLFSQHFFDYFNFVYANEEKIFWHGMCFCIDKEKINSYIKFRSTIIRNVMTAYFLKRMKIKDAGRIKMEERIEKCKNFDGYERIKKIEKGTICLEGEKLELEEFLNGNIKKIEEKLEENLEEYFDITKWDAE